MSTCLLIGRKEMKKKPVTDELALLEDERESGITERIVPGYGTWDNEAYGHLQRYEVVAKEMQPHHIVLDAGCGTGYGADFLLKRGAEKIIGVDISSRAINFAIRNYDDKRLTWLQDDCQELNIAEKYGPFDIICCLENLEHLKAPENFLNKVSKILKPDGKLIVSVPSRLWLNLIANRTPNAPPRNPYHVKEYTRQEFLQLLQGYFNNVNVLYQTFTEDCMSAARVLPMILASWNNPMMRMGRMLRTLKSTIAKNQDASLMDLVPTLIVKIDEKFYGDVLTVNYIGICSSLK